MALSLKETVIANGAQEVIEVRPGSTLKVIFERLTKLDFRLFINE